MSDTSIRLGLPLLAAGQAQKEIAHNEALTALDALVHPAVEAIGTTTPPPAPVPGQSWVTGTGAGGAWAGQDGMLATWMAGGWRFAAPPIGTLAWRRDLACYAVLSVAGWTTSLPLGGVTVGGNPVVGPRGAAVSPPSGGTTIDAEARSAIVAILSRLTGHGLIAP